MLCIRHYRKEATVRLFIKLEYFTGIRRKRLKGDTWAYKKVYEEILKEAGL